jgi:hypothetical protein
VIFPADKRDCYRREHVVFPDFCRGREEVTIHNKLHELAHLTPTGQWSYSGLGTFQAAQSLLAGEFGGVASIHFGELF